MKKIIAVLLLVFSGYGLFAQQKQTVSEAKGAFKTYTDIKEKVSIKYPVTWEHKPYSTAVFLFMRPVEERGQKLRENIDLFIGPAQDLALIEYLEDARKKYKESVEGFKELKSEFIKINGLDFVKMVYQFTNGNINLRCILYLAIAHDKAYSLNCTALSTTFDKYYPLFETMAESFRIK